jgi:hypothetical protein
MSIPKANKPQGQSSRSLRRRTRLPHTVTSHMVSERSRKNKSNPSPAQTSIRPRKPKFHCCNGPEADALISRGIRRLLVLDKSRVGNVGCHDLPCKAVIAFDIIIVVDYPNANYNVIKNRNGKKFKNLRLDTLAAFLMHPNSSCETTIDFMQLYCYARPPELP